MSDRRSLAAEFEKPDTEAEEIELIRALQDAMALDNWYEAPEWQAFFAMLTNLRVGDIDSLTKPGLPPAETEFVRGRVSAWTFLIDQQGRNATKADHDRARLKEIADLQEEEDA